jgi:prepilin-type N-terminal cleavage/methylation domain-containing protein
MTRAVGWNARWTKAIPDEVARRPRHGERGFTMVEILVALTILALILVPLLAGFDWSMGQTGQSNLTTAATNLARQILETARAEGSTSSGFPVAGAGRAAVAGTRFQAETIVTTNTTMNFEQVVVNVYNGTATTPLVSLTSVIGP